MRHAVCEPHHFESGLGVLAALAPGQGGQRKGQLDVLVGGEHRHQVVELENEADVARAPAGEFRLAQPDDVRAADQEFARIGLVDAGNEVEQRALARARWAHQREELAARDVEADVAQHL